MKQARLVVALTMVLSTAALAGPGQDDLETLAQASGLTVRQVAMLLGPHTAYVEYRAGYDRSRDKFMKAVREGRIPVSLVAARTAADGAQPMVALVGPAR